MPPDIARCPLGVPCLQLRSAALTSSQVSSHGQGRRHISSSLCLSTGAMEKVIVVPLFHLTSAEKFICRQYGGGFPATPQLQESPSGHMLGLVVLETILLDCLHRENCMVFHGKGEKLPPYQWVVTSQSRKPICSLTPLVLIDSPQRT